MSEAPERIWREPDIWFPECEKQYGCDIGYVRLDLYEELEAKLAKATGALERIVGGEFDGVMLLSLPPKDAARSYAASILAELKGDK